MNAPICLFNEVMRKRECVNKNSTVSPDVPTLLYERNRTVAESV